MESHRQRSFTPSHSSRRSFLQWLAYGSATIGGIFAAIPFLRTFAPSEKAKAVGAPVDIDISKIAAGQLLTTPWRGKPIWVLRRSKAMLESLPAVTATLQDPASQSSSQPDYINPEYRSRKPEILVLVGICTHLGCIPLFKPESGDTTIASDWAGGFYCPCHGSRFDLAGRVVKNVPAPTNLAVPPYAFVDDSTIRIGVDTVEQA